MPWLSAWRTSPSTGTLAMSAQCWSPTVSSEWVVLRSSSRTTGPTAAGPTAAGPSTSWSIRSAPPSAPTSGAMFQRKDDQGKIGVALSKDLMAVAGDALKTNITTLGPLVLPMSEQLLFLATLIARKLFKMKTLKPDIPGLKLAFEHFCIHAGGGAVLDELEKNLDLSQWHMEPSRMTLYRFGNTSSSSLWYELAYTEAKGRVRKGDRLWQIAFGSGFKCNSAVWHALRTVNPAKEKNPWMDEIDNFPVDVPKIVTVST